MEYDLRVVLAVHPGRARPGNRTIYYFNMYVYAWMVSSVLEH